MNHQDEPSIRSKSSPVHPTFCPCLFSCNFCSKNKEKEKVENLCKRTGERKKTMKYSLICGRVVLDRFYYGIFFCSQSCLKFLASISDFNQTKAYELIRQEQFFLIDQFFTSNLIFDRSRTTKSSFEPQIVTQDKWLIVTFICSRLDKYIILIRILTKNGLKYMRHRTIYVPLGQWRLAPILTHVKSFILPIFVAGGNTSNRTQGISLAHYWT